MLLHQIIASTIDGKVLKSHTKSINLKYQFLRRIKNLNYLMDYILYSIIKIIFEYIIKRHETLTDNLLIRMYVNKIDKI